MVRAWPQCWGRLIDERDVLEQARITQGIDRMDRIRYAVLERNGTISIVPKPD